MVRMIATLSSNGITSGSARPARSRSMNASACWSSNPPPRGLPAAPLGFDGVRRPVPDLPPGALLSLPALHTEYDEDVTEARWLPWAP